MLRYMTAGESHGALLSGILEGMPSGVMLDEAFINAELKRRQSGYGRGARQTIESDTIEITAGVLGGKTTGAPIGLIIRNKDNTIAQMPDLTRPRPGHADLAGSLKYHEGIRPVLERSSARNTAMRVAIGAIVRSFMKTFGIECVSQVVQVGEAVNKNVLTSVDAIKKAVAHSQLQCTDPMAEAAMKAAIDAAEKNGDTLGGVIEVRVHGMPVGLGSCMHPDRTLDGRIAQAVMSIQAIKAVAFGAGCAYAAQSGSHVHDVIMYDRTSGYSHATNNAGGIEGGMTNGEDVIVRAVMKPIATLKKPLASVDVHTKEKAEASFERSDTCAIAACAVVAESAVAFEIANAFSEKFGGDSLVEIHRNYTGYLSQIQNA